MGGGRARQAVAASGAHSVAVGGDVVGSIVVAGNLELGPDAEQNVLLLRRLVAEQAPTKSRRARPLNDPPEPPEDRVGRDPEMADLVAAVGNGGVISLYGEEEIGKTYVLCAALPQLAGEMPDGIVYVDAARRPIEDVLQALFVELYDCRPPLVAPPEHRRADLAGVRALVVIDEASLEGSAAQRLRREVPRSVVVVASRAPAFDAGAGIRLAGLPPGDGVALIERCFGARLDATGRLAAERLATLLRGHPRRLAQAARLARDLRIDLPALAAALEDNPVGELRRRLLAAMSPEERRLLDALTGAAGETLGAEPAGELSGVRDADKCLAGMEARALVRRGSPRYRPSGVLSNDTLEAERERAAVELARWARRQDWPETALDELPALLSLLRWAQQDDRHELVLDLVRAIDRVAVAGGRWGRGASPKRRRDTPRAATEISPPRRGHSTSSARAPTRSVTATPGSPRCSRHWSCASGSVTTPARPLPNTTPTSSSAARATFRPTTSPRRLQMAAADTSRAGRRWPPRSP